MMSQPPEPESESKPNSSVAQIHDLPNEILVYVFSFFSPRELCGRVTRVCQRWHCLAYDHSLWTKLHVSDLRLTSQQMHQIVCRVSGAIKDLKIARLRGLSVTGFNTVIKNCPELVHLDVRGTDLNVSMIRSILSCRHLQSLSLRQCKFGLDVVSEICLRAGPVLKRFRFDGSSMTDYCVLQLVESIKDVTHFTLDGVDLNDNTAIRLIVHYKRSLQVLRWDATYLTDLALHRLFFCHCLRELSMLKCENITDQSLPALKKLENLNKLVLRRAKKLHPLGLIDLFSTSTLASLTHLDLKECLRLCDKGVQAISQTCGSKLTFLCLSWCQCVSDEGLSHVASKCTVLERLELTGLLRPHGVWLPTATLTMNHLTFVTFQLCQNVSVSTMKEAVKQKRGLTILDCYGAKVDPSTQ